MRIKRVGQPVLNSPNDPTGIGSIRAHAQREFKQKLDNAYRRAKVVMKDYLDRSLVGTEIVNKFVINHDQPQILMNRVNYIYETDPNRLLDVNRFIAQILDEELLGGTDGFWSLNWWFSKYDSQSVNSGVVDSLDSIQSIASPENVGIEDSYEIRRISYEDMLQTPRYRRALDNVYSRTFNQMKMFASENADKLAQILGKAVTTGESYSSAIKAVNKQFFGMSGYRAKRIVRTELNHAYTTAYMQNSRELNRTVFTGKYEVRVMHLSILNAEISRKTHMARHGRIFTLEEQEEWWAEGANRINCYCSVADVMVNTKTGEVLQKALVKRANDQRKELLGAEN